MQEANEEQNVPSVRTVLLVWHLPPPHLKWEQRRFVAVCETQDGVLDYLHSMERTRTSIGGGYIAEEVPLWP